MKNIILGVSVISLCMIFPVIAGEEGASNGLDRILGNASIGVAFSDFAPLHPEAVYSDADISDIPVSPEQPGALQINHDEDPFLGLPAYANIGFKDGLLYELVAVWVGDSKTVEDKRRRFFTAALQRHGQAYLHETILVYPHTPEARPVAVFMWQEPTATTLAFYTAASGIDPHPKAALTYAQFTPGDPFLKDIIEKNPPTAEQQEQAWKMLADIAPLLEAVEQAK